MIATLDGYDVMRRDYTSNIPEPSRTPSSCITRCFSNPPQHTGSRWKCGERPGNPQRVFQHVAAAIFTLVYNASPGTPRSCPVHLHHKPSKASHHCYATHSSDTITTTTTPLPLPPPPHWASILIPDTTTLFESLNTTSKCRTLHLRTPPASTPSWPH
ncbi:hypothetical protein EX30DRAFT_246960 [Ascodesmis nigricans]|uniref:Uncharacterized protein n=1 Tax=Ascodesmis nigricans TaxID=341454 RepID=A0A4S2MHW7_9PEZI|nr:hypothetical protein EX30DRAFT_246960 [Ascodesmis nigricans]